MSKSNKQRKPPKPAARRPDDLLRVTSVRDPAEVSIDELVRLGWEQGVVSVELTSRADEAEARAGVLLAVLMKHGVPLERALLIRAEFEQGVPIYLGYLKAVRIDAGARRATSEAEGDTHA